MKKQISCTPKTAVAYARYSSAGQRDVSIDQQLSDIRAYADREGYTIVHEYADRAKSGYHNTSARAEFMAMIADAEKGTFDTIITWKVDRFGRNREEAAIFKAQLRRGGVSVVYAMEPIPSGAAGVLTEGMLEALAEWYSRNLSENITRGMRDNAVKALHNGSRLFGYQRGPDGHLIEHPDEAAAVRAVFKRYIEGYSAATIAAELNAKGLKTPHGHAFRPETVLRMIKNERYTGIYIWSDIRIPGGMPQIIAPKQFKAAQDMLTKTGRHINQGRTDFILTGKAFCGECGDAMTGDSGKSPSGVYYYYTCHNKKSGQGCKKRSVRKDYLEDTVLKFICDNCLTPKGREIIADKMMDVQKKKRQSSPLALMQKELAEVKKKIDNINSAIEAGIWNDSTAVRLKTLEDSAAVLQRNIDFQKYSDAQAISKKDILAFLERMTHYKITDPNSRRQLVNVFVNSVYVYDDHLHIIINAFEGNSTVPLSEVESTVQYSDGDTPAPPSVTHPNKWCVIYTVNRA